MCTSERGKKILTKVSDVDTLLFESLGGPWRDEPLNEIWSRGELLPGEAGAA